MLLAARESARILFGLGRVAFFLLQPARSVLSGASVGGQPVLLQRLEIPLEAELSLAAEAALKGHTRSSFDTERPVPVSLIDVQIARALNSEGILCVPMLTSETLVGVIVFGISAIQFARTRKRIAWLNSFARLTATTLETWRKMRDRDMQIEAAVVGRFRLQARKAAHEAGNPLGIIKNYLKLILQKLPDDSELGDQIGILREEIDRVAQIVRQLSEVSTTATQSGQVDINELIEGMRALYGEMLFESSGIELVLDLAPQLALAIADRNSVKQILLNLWKNAAEASPAGSRFVISTWDSVNQNGRFYVEIRLSDSGPGLPPEVMQSLYQPLDSSSKPGHAGLGLSIVAALVDKLGGHITCQSRPSHGTTFVVLLPQVARSDK
jgi:signal transduction histidine kinase